MNEIAGRTPTIKRSLYREAMGELERFRTTTNHDHESASTEWNRKHWWRWSRMRWLEHLKGEICWSELDEQDFGFVHEYVSCNKDLLYRILDKIHEGEENLNIINWALELDGDIDEVIRILARLDMNKCRVEMQNAMP